MSNSVQAAAAYDLGPLSLIPIGEGRTFQVAGVPVAVFRGRNGEIYATQAACPHKGGPLADGILGAGTLICPLHSYKFKLATGESVGDTCPPLRTYRVTLSEGGRVLLWL